MNNQTRLKILAGVLGIVLVTLACGPTVVTQTKVPAAPVQSGINPTSVTPIKTSTGTGELSSDQKSRLAHATVRIWGVVKKGGKMVPIYHGSGTILTPDGMILTNCHVADPVAMGFSEKFKPDLLVIEVVDTEDKPPVPTYLAEVVAKDNVLDLAIIRISSNLDGSRLDKANFKLPWVSLGDSDNLKFGDKIYVFGYPSIGGDTITYSTGDVSGFDTDPTLGNRAWIKTEAAISGGNSGGLAANVNGEIIGIPTQIGTSSASEKTDCRIIQDTNGDGVIDEKDTCIPTGGFINGIRPVNWALSLIQSARTGVAYVSPYEQPDNLQPLPQPTQPPQPNNQQPINPVNPNQAMGFNFVGWSTQVNQNDNCPVNTVTSFPTGTLKIISAFKYQNIPNGTKFNYTWLVDGRDTADGNVDWAPQYPCFDFTLSNKNDPVPDGKYTLEIYYNNQTVAQVETSIGGTSNGGGNQQQGGVTLMGKVTDANTGKGIAQVYVLLLNPGVDPDAWRNNTNQDDIFSSTKTDSKGNYQLADLLQRGSTYGIVVGNKTIGYGVVTGTIKVSPNGDDTINLPIQLSK